MNINAIYNLLHVISALFWVGGMIFAHTFLRPVAASQLEPPQRLQLWCGVFARFFPIVWGSIILLPLTGYLMIFSIWKTMSATPLYVHIMLAIGILMTLIFLHVFFSPYKKLKMAVSSQDWPSGGKAIGQIRKLVGLNIILGLIVVFVASAGRYIVL
jgi:uncharacterized membrane protein